MIKWSGIEYLEFVKKNLTEMVMIPGRIKIPKRRLGNAIVSLDIAIKLLKKAWGDRI